MEYSCVYVLRVTERVALLCLQMTYVQAISGRGGWPMSVWLTPDLKPIYGGTYYPLRDVFQVGGHRSHHSRSDILSFVQTMLSPQNNHIWIALMQNVQ